MDWNAICARLAADMDALDGINAFDSVPDSIPTIAAIVGEIDIDLNVTMRKARSGTTRVGTDQANITIRILVARYNDRQALRKLREYMTGSGPMSVVQALENDRHLGGLVDDSMVKNMQGNRMFDVGGDKYYGIELTLFVIGDA
jgi:hypothetical protein